MVDIQGVGLMAGICRVVVIHTLQHPCQSSKMCVP